jgi:hypothetical protein
MDAVRTLAGRYELVEVIGRGGMGTVYRASDLVLRRPVAVKLLPGPLADQDPTSVARFEREARAAAALNNPAVVAVYDTGADETTRFIVMELISGDSLEAILRDDGPLDPDRAAGIASRVADALAAAHAAGIVHRDIKPANVMVAEDGSVKVLDFGIARAMDATTVTQNASVLGTAAYMAPERALGKPADERSDIYSLGCVLYALLAGHPPFRGDSAAAVLNQHANVAPRPLRGENSRVSPELDAAVMQMLAKSPDDRPQTAVEVRDRLTPPGHPAHHTDCNNRATTLDHRHATIAAGGSPRALVADPRRRARRGGARDRPGRARVRRKLTTHHDERAAQPESGQGHNSQDKLDRAGVEQPGDAAHRFGGCRGADHADYPGCPIRQDQSTGSTTDHQRPFGHPQLLRNGPHLGRTTQTRRPLTARVNARTAGTDHIRSGVRSQQRSREPQHGTRERPSADDSDTRRPTTRLAPAPRSQQTAARQSKARQIEGALTLTPLGLPNCRACARSLGRRSTAAARSID